jgi:hypothetical protein
MKLIYRGSTYDYSSLRTFNPVCRVAPYDLYYRGFTYRVTPERTRHPTQTVTHQLIYRGNVYWVTRSIADSETICNKLIER